MRRRLTEKFTSSHIVYKRKHFSHLSLQLPFTNRSAQKANRIDMHLAAITLLVLAAANFCQAQNSYCTLSTCTSNTNTLCKYSSTSWGAACQPAYSSKSNVTTVEIPIILKAHNDYRRRVAKGLETRGLSGPQPAASNMRELIWDDELAVMAQTHAQQCVFGHDACRNVARFKVGQNLYISGSPKDDIGTSNWNDAVTSWYNEVDNMAIEFVSSFPSNSPKVIGHYTAAVWATTTYVGCGVAYYQSTALWPTNPYNRYYVCNYGPSGNYIGTPIYSQGPAGSACPSGTVNNDGLCAISA